MRIGIFADSHDHLANIRLAVERFNAEEVEVVLFVGDIVSTIAVPPLKRLRARVVACFGDNEGNKIGLRAGFSQVGEISEAPVRYVATDGTRFVIVHMKRQLRSLPADEEFDIQIIGHTHKPWIEKDDNGRLLINPGETSGWSFGRPTIAVLETTTREVQLIDLKPIAERIKFGGVAMEDFEDVLKLRIAAMQESLERLGRFDPALARERMQRSFYPEHSQFILLDGRQAGFYTLRPVGDDLHLDHFYIHPRCQSQGLGSHVLRQLLARADQLQRPVRLGALRDSRSNAFYQRHGFVQTSEDEWDIYYLRPPQAIG